MGAHGKLFGLLSNGVGSQTPMCVFHIKTLRHSGGHTETSVKLLNFDLEYMSTYEYSHNCYVYIIH